MANQATFRQAVHYMMLAEQAGIPDSVDRVQALYDTGILSAVLQTPDPEAVNLDHLRRVLASEPLTRVSPSVLWTLTSDGRSAAKLIRDIEANGRQVGDWAKDIMFKPQFVTTNGVIYQLVGIRGDEFADGKRTTRHIFAEGARRGYPKPPAEAAALLRERLTQEELVYPYVVVFHEPIRDSYGDPRLLGLDRDAAGGWLGAWFAHPDGRWYRESLFLFLAPQVSET